MKKPSIVSLALRLCRLIDLINLWTGRLVSWLAVLLVVLVFGNVAARYCFNTSSVFARELEWHFFAALFLLGGGSTLLKEGHVRVDIIYQRLSKRARAWINMLGVLFLLLPGCWLLISTAAPFVANSFHMAEGSPDPGGIPWRFVPKSLIIPAFLLMALQGLSLGIKSLLFLLGRLPDSPSGRNHEVA